MEDEKMPEQPDAPPQPPLSERDDHLPPADPSADRGDIASEREESAVDEHAAEAAEELHDGPPADVEG